MRARMNPRDVRNVRQRRDIIRVAWYHKPHPIQCLSLQWKATRRDNERRIIISNIILTRKVLLLIIQK